MKKTRLTFFFIALLFIGFSFTSCDDDDENILSDDEEISVESVEWKSDLKNGLELSLSDNSLNVANRMNIFPEDATNQKQTFSSSNNSVATISDQGQVMPVSLGTTTITVTVDEKTDQFELKVVQQKIVNVSSISITEKDIAININSTENLAAKFAVLPSNASNKAVTYESSAPSIVSVDESGMITGLQLGTATITVKSVDNTSATGEFNITVKEVSFTGDYPRDNWTMTASHELPIDDTNSLTSPFDENYNTWFGLVRPSKSYKGITVPATEGIYFIVDMKVSQPVNYFRLRHRNETQIFLRYKMIEEISGSDDGVNFTTIANNVAVTDYANSDIVSPNITIPKSNYRYLKFYCQKNECFHSMSQGSSAQFSEIYFGIE